MFRLAILSISLLMDAIDEIKILEFAEWQDIIFEKDNRTIEYLKDYRL